MIGVNVINLTFLWFSPNSLKCPENEYGLGKIVLKRIELFYSTFLLQILNVVQSCNAILNQLLLLFSLYAIIQI